MSVIWDEPHRRADTPSGAPLLKEVRPTKGEGPREEVETLEVWLTQRRRERADAF
jgi:hypothetical protein